MIELPCPAGQHGPTHAQAYQPPVAASNAAFATGGAGAVVLARADSYTDALVAAPLAAAKNGPLLLTSGDTLPAGTQA